MKHRQIASLGTQRSQHFVATMCARGRDFFFLCSFINQWKLEMRFHVGNLCSVFIQGVKTTSWRFSPYIYLPPCFLLSSPFWSPFFGCSLGLWGCCEIKANIQKVKQNSWTDSEKKITALCYNCNDCPTLVVDFLSDLLPENSGNF